MARITKVSVSAGRTFNHPYERFANLRSHVQFEAEVQEGENCIAVAKGLQSEAEMLADTHKQNCLRAIREDVIDEDMEDDDDEEPEDQT